MLQITRSDAAPKSALGLFHFVHPQTATERVFITVERRPTPNLTRLPLQVALPTQLTGNATTRPS